MDPREAHPFTELPLLHGSLLPAQDIRYPSLFCQIRIYGYHLLISFRHHGKTCRQLYRNPEYPVCFLANIRAPLPINGWIVDFFKSYTRPSTEKAGVQ